MFPRSFHNIPFLLPAMRGDQSFSWEHKTGTHERIKWQIRVNQLSKSFNQNTKLRETIVHLRRLGEVAHIYLQKMTQAVCS